MGSGYRIDADESIVDLVIDHPTLIDVFQQLSIEYTCGGKSLRAACEQRGLVPAEVIQMCQRWLGDGTL